MQTLEYQKQQLATLTAEVEAMEAQVEQSTVKEHELMAVTALIEEKALLNEQKVALKKSCREEQARLDRELERIKKRNEDMLKAEHAEFLVQIDEEFELENEKLTEHRKQIAEVNVAVTTLQRKIDNIPSKIEITQFHKRLVELFEALNVTAEECKRFVNIFNTVQDSQRFFKQQESYLKEISTNYKACKHKKEKEALLLNL